MTELDLTIVIELDDELGDAEQHKEPIYEGFLKYIQNDPALGNQQTFDTGVGYHEFPDPEANDVVYIQGTIESYNGVDYINDEGNREGLEMDLTHAVKAHLPAAFLERCSIQTTVMDWLGVHEAAQEEVDAAIEEVEA